MIKPSRNVLLVVAALFVVVVAIAAYTVVATLRAADEPSPRPALAASVGTTLEDVHPMQFCTDVRALQCDAAATPRKLSVEPGKALVISLPKYITSRPWDVTIQRYDTINGQATLETRTHVEPTKDTLILKSTDALLLAAVEIRVPSDVQDQFGNLISQAVWGIDTLAKDYALVQKP